MSLRKCKEGNQCVGPVVSNGRRNAAFCLQTSSWRKVWNDTITINGEEHDPLTLMHEWLDHKRELGERKLREVLRGAMALELDCERRAAKKIDQFYLPINLKEYIQKANAYVYFYLAMQHVRRWYQPGRAPFSLPEVWTKMPTDFDNDYTRLPKKRLNCDRTLFNLLKTIYKTQE